MNNYPFKRVLVTGGAGFIGSSFIEQLIHLNSKVEILNIDNVSYSVSNKTIKLLDKFSNHSHLKIDIANNESIKKIVKEFNPELLINFAAESHVDNSIDSAFPFINTNIIGTFNLLESFRELSSESNRLFHHISTDEVYGDLNFDEDPFNELSQYKPSSPYSASKAASDMLVHSWGRTHKVPYLITNCSNNFGPRQFTEKLIPKIIINAMNQENIPVYGDGLNIRDWIFFDDHTKILLKLHMKKIVNDSINIGSKCEKSNLEIINAISEILKEKYSIILQYSFVEDRPGHDKRYAIDMSKAEKLLNTKIKNKFISNIEKTVDWYIDNYDWWKN